MQNRYKICSQKQCCVALEHECTHNIGDDENDHTPYFEAL